MWDFIYTPAECFLARFTEIRQPMLASFRVSLLSDIFRKTLGGKRRRQLLSVGTQQSSETEEGMQLLVMGICCTYVF